MISSLSYIRSFGTLHDPILNGVAASLSQLLPLVDVPLLAITTQIEPTLLKSSYSLKPIKTIY